MTRGKDESLTAERRVSVRGEAITKNELRFQFKATAATEGYIEEYWANLPLIQECRVTNSGETVTYAQMCGRLTGTGASKDGRLSTEPWEFGLGVGLRGVPKNLKSIRKSDRNKFDILREFQGNLADHLEAY